MWNVQGVGKPEFRETVKEIIKRRNPSIVALSETPLNGMYPSRLATEIRLLGHMRVDTVGFSGGGDLALLEQK